MNSKRFKSEMIGIGMMSGTSADGLDIALVRIWRDPAIRFALLNFTSKPYSRLLQKIIFDIAAPDGGNVEDVCRLNFLLGEVWADMVLEYLKETDFSPDQIDFLASHGQTVCHLPEKTDFCGRKIAATLQIGEPSVLANRTGILTIGDFRTADVALGGEGAPLVPFFDSLIFRSDDVSRILLNIGGIANITILPAEKQQKVVAFDTGPGNCLLDALARKWFDQPFDERGNIARRGKILEKLLAWLLKDPYLKKESPKSTGREYYLGPFLEELLAVSHEIDAKPEDILATVTEFTAQSIALHCKKYLLSPNFPVEVIVSGGGRENLFLMERLKTLLMGSHFRPIEDFGLPSEAKEAVCFAVLGYCTLNRIPANLPQVTGAERPAILGKICQPPN